MSHKRFFLASNDIHHELLTSCFLTEDDLLLKFSVEEKLEGLLLRFSAEAYVLLNEVVLRKVTESSSAGTKELLALSNSSRVRLVVKLRSLLDALLRLCLGA